ncbi:glutamate ligase domain-containing protein [Sharpea azabuensis]|uniref:glutamate ligase domain-containing protein n=1 Tax=Sharpea azabuensis TaxID=322505 RepID=UPI001567EA2D|nr:Mur ligase family protein [Sharpea azabuensis]
MEIKILDHITETQVTNIIEASGGRHILKTPGTLTLVATVGSEVVGFIELERMETVTLIYAKPGNIQVEVFASLLDAVERIGLNRIILHPSATSIAFFKSFGYHEVGNGSLVKILPKSHDFKNAQEVYDFINHQKDRVYSLEQFQKFMEDAYNIQDGLASLHIGGTNGKGSTVNYTKEVLKVAGYNIGTFTSPALIHPLDIICVDDQAIDERTMVAIANRFMGDFLDYGLSKFEMEVFIAIIYFYYRAVDLAIFEVGLGGLLDATNVIKPLLAVNTNIGLDHVDYLGHTYKEIAMNKAGIIKDHVDYMTGEGREECLEVFREVCQKHESKLIQIKLPENVTYHQTSIEYDYHEHHIHLNTTARYQVNNSVMAINILESLSRYFPFDKEDLTTGLAQAHWAGRFEIIHLHPTVIIDGAHNKEGMEAFANSVNKDEPMKIIYSALRDKDTHHMIETLCKLTDDVTVTEFPHPRAATIAELSENMPVKKDENWQHAVDEALKGDKKVYITGSLYFISLVRAYILGKELA